MSLSATRCRSHFNPLLKGSSSSKESETLNMFPFKSLTSQLQIWKEIKPEFLWDQMGTGGRAVSSQIHDRKIIVSWTVEEEWG